MTDEMTITIGRVDEAGLETGETDSVIENGLQIGGEIGVESATIVTGEMTPMMRHEGAAGILLTRGPVAEWKIRVPKVALERTWPRFPRYVDSCLALGRQFLTCIRRSPRHRPQLRSQRQTKRLNALPSWRHGRRKWLRIKSVRKKSLPPEAIESYWMK